MPTLPSLTSTAPEQGTGHRTIWRVAATGTVQALSVMEDTLPHWVETPCDHTLVFPELPPHLSKACHDLLRAYLGDFYGSVDAHGVHQASGLERVNQVPLLEAAVAFLLASEGYSVEVYSPAVPEPTYL